MDWHDGIPKCFKCILLFDEFIVSCLLFYQFLLVATHVIIIVVMHVDFYKIQCGYFTRLNPILNWFCVNLCAVCLGMCECAELLENEFMYFDRKQQNDDVDWPRMVKRTSMRCGDAC